MDKEKVKWLTLENEHATRTLKQHAFIADDRLRKYTLERYPGNRCLCNLKAGVMNEKEDYEAWDLLDSEVLDEKNCCKSCLAISLPYRYE